MEKLLFFTNWKPEKKYYKGKTIYSIEKNGRYKIIGVYITIYIVYIFAHDIVYVTIILLRVSNTILYSNRRK